MIYHIFGKTNSGSGWFTHREIYDSISNEYGFYAFGINVTDTKSDLYVWDKSKHEFLKTVTIPAFNSIVKSIKSKVGINVYEIVSLYNRLVYQKRPLSYTTNLWIEDSVGYYNYLYTDVYPLTKTFDRWNGFHVISRLRYSLEEDPALKKITEMSGDSLFFLPYFTMCEGAKRGKGYYEMVSLQVFCFDINGQLSNEFWINDFLKVYEKR